MAVSKNIEGEQVYPRYDLTNNTDWEIIFLGWHKEYDLYYYGNSKFYDSYYVICNKDKIYCDAEDFCDKRFYGRSIEQLEALGFARNKYKKLCWTL